MLHRRPLFFVFALAIGSALALTTITPRAANAQILQRMKDAAKKKAEEASKTAKKDSVASDAKKAEQSATTVTQATSGAAGRQKEWANYDFVPGSNVLF
jgi:hypothetical protein